MDYNGMNGKVYQVTIWVRVIQSIEISCTFVF